MNNPYIRLQAILNIESDADLIRHFRAVQSSHASLKSQADVIRYILQRDMEVARVYGVTWDWRNIVRTPPWMEKILAAIKSFDGQARVVVEDEEAVNRVEIGEGFFDE